MKRFILLGLVSLILLGLCACGEGGENTGNTVGASIDSALTGMWYGPGSDPVLNISADGTGTAEYKEESYPATFSAQNNIFTVSSQGYSISGDYTHENNILTVLIEYNEESYTLVFTRKPVETPEVSCLFTINEKNYEIVPKEGKITEVTFPPVSNPDYQEVYFVAYNEGEIVHVYPHPPEGYCNAPAQGADTPGQSGTSTPQNSENVTPTDAPSQTEAPVTTQADDKTDEPTADNKDKKEIPVPETIDYTDSPPTIELDGEKIQTLETGYDITGTWSNSSVDTYYYIFGITGQTQTPIVYTFNSDGTGTVTAMGIFTGTIKYSVDNGVLDLTVSMFGETESGTGYVKRIGDMLYIRNAKDEEYVLQKDN